MRIDHIALFYKNLQRAFDAGKQMAEKIMR